MSLEGVFQKLSLFLEASDFCIKCLICFQAIIVFSSSLLHLYSSLDSAFLGRDFVFLSLLEDLVSVIRRQQINLEIRAISKSINLSSTKLVVTCIFA